jgi:hypothetical protein
MSAQGDPRLAFAILAGFACIGGLLIFFVLPIIGRFSIGVEALSLLIAGIGEYFGNPRVIWLGCLVFLLVTAACCFIVVIIGGSLLTCSTANPSQLCRLVGR